VELPAVKLTGDLMYDILLGEIAVQRGHYDKAAGAMASAAISSGDYRVAERASLIALRAKDYERALQSAELWAELQPNSTKPLQTIGAILTAQGRLDEAEERFKELIERAEPNVGIVYRRIADLLAQHHDIDGVLELMDRLVMSHPADADAYFAKAYLADRVKNTPIVLQSLDKALSLRPGWQEAALAKFAHYASQKDLDGARQFSETFLEEYPAASKLRLHYARYLIDEGERELALENFKILVEYEPKNADATFAAALLSVQLDRYEEAEKYLKSSVKLRPSNDQARLYLGQISTEQEQYEKAATWYRAIKSENLYFEAQVLLANVLGKQKGIDEALDHLDGLHPRSDDEQVRIILSKEQIFRVEKMLDEAKTVLDQGLAQFPDNTELLYARGLVAAQLELIAVHEQDMRRLLEKDPKNAHALNALGYTLADQTQRYHEALELIGEALKLKPDDPFIMDSMGWVHYRLGNHQLAIDYLEKALEKREDAEIAAHLGEVLWVTGDKTRAEKVLKRALKKSPDNDVLLTTIEKLKQ
jgi:tetratricopeptide (TPR) repeat protein